MAQFWLSAPSFRGLCRTGFLLIVIGFCLLSPGKTLLAGVSVSKVLPRGFFDGQWKGEYEEKGGPGTPGGVYVLTEHEKERLTGTGTWGKQGEHSMKLKGTRLGENVLRLEGRYTDRATGAATTCRYYGSTSRSGSNGHSGLPCYSGKS